MNRQLQIKRRRSGIDDDRPTSELRWSIEAYNDSMADLFRIERELLRMSPAERERIALKAWESLIEDVKAVSDPNIDPDGVELASKRDEELQCGKVPTINEKEFRRRTGQDE